MSAHDGSQEIQIIYSTAAFDRADRLSFEGQRTVQQGQAPRRIIEAAANRKIDAGLMGDGFVRVVEADIV